MASYVNRGNLEMQESSKLRDFFSQLEQMKITKENYVLSLEKQASEKLKEEQDKLYGKVEQNFEKEVLHTCKLQKVEDRIRCLRMEIDIKEQIIMKKIRKSIEEADSLLKSVNSKENETFDSRYLYQQEKAKKREEIRIHRLKDLMSCEDSKKLRKELEAEKEKLIDYSAEQQYLLDDLRDQLVKEERRKVLLEKREVQLDLMQEQQKLQSDKKELTDLREEHDCITKLKEDEEILEIRKITMEEAEKKVLQEREEQLRYKEQQELCQNTRDKEYLKMLIELQGEEGKLEATRLQVRRRQEMQHRLAAQQLLEERRKRRKHAMEKFLNLERDEKLLQETREQLMREEEKKLLLTYMPHLGPFLSASILQKLSTL